MSVPRRAILAHELPARIEDARHYLRQYQGRSRQDHRRAAARHRIVRMGNRVTVLDADPQYWISRWHDISAPMPNLKVVSYVTQASLERHLDDHRATTDYFLIDLRGARSPLLSKAIGLSDHV